MSRPWILVCPASRGIGLHLTRHLLRTTRAPILATTRAADLAAAKQHMLDFCLSPAAAAAAVVEEKEEKGKGSSRQEQKGGKEEEEEEEEAKNHRKGKFGTTEKTRQDLLTTATTTTTTTAEAAAAAAAARRLTVVRLDVTDESTIRAAAAEARRLFPFPQHHLRLAAAIPGVLRPERSPAQIELGAALDMFRVNTLGQMLLMKHFCEFLPRRSTEFFVGEDGEEGGEGGAQGLPPRHAVWAAMSARVGSTTDNRAGGWYGYRASKAGVTSLARSLDAWLAARSGDRAAAVAYHPGTVRTDLSRAFWETVPRATLLEPGFAAERMCEVLTREVGVEGRGRFWDWKGEEVPP